MHPNERAMLAWEHDRELESPEEFRWVIGADDLQDTEANDLILEAETDEEALPEAPRKTTPSRIILPASVALCYIIFLSAVHMLRELI